MNRMLHFLLLVAVILSGKAGVPRAMAQESQSHAGAALETIFDPHRAPERKSMGLLQRSFLDVVETTQTHLEVALVVDGTDSMADELTGVRRAMRSMMNDLRRYKGDADVKFQIVVYRDIGAASGEVTIPLSGFTDDITLLEKTIREIKPESGAPYFPELIDLGLHTALTSLNWSDTPDTSRWVFLFGDAPPFDSGFPPDPNEEKTGARRRYENDALIQAAQRMKAQVHCVLCTSRDSEKETYKRVLDKTRRFMNDVSSNTGGLMLDLSYPDIQKALSQAVKKQRVETSLIGTITQQDVDARRKQAEQVNLIASPSDRLRFAVLPHLPVDQMVFDPDRPEVQVATQLRNQFKVVPRVSVKSPVDVERGIRRAQARGLNAEQIVPALCTLLNVDYLVAGTYSNDGSTVTIKSSVFSRRQGKIVAEESLRSGTNQSQRELALRIGDKLIQAASQRAGDQLLASTLASYLQSSGGEVLIQPVALNDAAQSNMLAGFEALEQALAYGGQNNSEPHPKSKPLLDLAVKRLQAAIAEDARDGLAHRLLADAYFNLALHATMMGQPSENETAQYKRALKQAYRFRANIKAEAIRREVEADYLLLVTEQYDEAIKAYQQLGEYQDQATLQATLRAHWMLAAIYSGDWDVPEDVVQPKEARKHIIEILANWPESKEAEYIRNNIRWNAEKGKNEFQHTPQTHTTLAQTIRRQE